MRTYARSWLIFVLLALAFGFTLGVKAFFSVSVDFRQGANNEPSGPVTGLGNTHWINSIIQQSNSTYFENMSVPQRVILTGMTGRTHTLVFSHQATKGGHHAYDFLTSYDQAVTAAAERGITLNLNPCGQEIGPPSTLAATCNDLRASSFTVEVPDDPFISIDGSTQDKINAYETRYGNRQIKLYSNQSIFSASLTLSHNVANLGDTSDSSIFYTLTWTTNAFSPVSDKALIELGGHLAVCGNGPAGVGWGAGKGAAEIGGGPYHFRLHSIDGVQLGSGDNQIKAGDIQLIPPTCAITGPNAACAGQQGLMFTATADATATYQWAITAGDATFCSGTTAQTVCVNAGTTNFTLQITTTNAAGSTSCSTNIVVNPIPTVIATGGQLTCAASAISLSVTASVPGSTFVWTGPGIVSGGNTATPTINMPGTYSVIATSPSGCVSLPAQALVTLDITPPNVTASANGILTCTTTQTTVTASSTTPNVTFSWTGPGIMGSLAGATIPVTQPGTYIVTATNTANGCTNTAQAVVTQDSIPPNVTAVANGALTCTVTQTTVTASSTTQGVSFSWAGPGIVGTNIGATVQVNQAGTYTVTATNPANGCTNTAQAIVTESGARPDVTAAASGMLNCTTTQVTLTASSMTQGVTFSWTGPGIMGSITGATIPVTQPGTYIVTATNPTNGCTNTAQVTVTQDITPPNVSATASGALTCTVTQATVTASSTTPNVTFSWTGPGIMGSVAGAAIPVTQPGTYTVTATNPVNGCTNTAQATVTQNITLPNVTAVSNGALTCATTQTSVTASSTTQGVTYSWTGPGIVGANTGATIQVNQPGTYTVTATNPANGCTNTAQTVVTRTDTPPNVTAVANGSLTCTVSQTSVTASSTTQGVTFSWTGPGIVGAATGATVQVNRAGTYSVTATNPADGCTNTAQAVVAQDLTPPTVNAGPDQSQCVTMGGTITFTLAGSVNRGTPQWSVISGPVVIADPNSLTSIVTFTGTGVATLRLRSTDGVCVSEDTVNLSAGGLQVSIAMAAGCEVPATLTANATGGVPPYTYQWTGPGGFTATTQTITATALGAYIVTVTDSMGCSGSNTAATCESVISDQKAGSILFYNYFSSNAAAPDLEDTRINLTNTNATMSIAVHLFFVDGSTCAVANRQICLTPNQTTSFLMSSFDPGTRGYILAVAVDLQTGCPVNFNFLIGDEYLKLASGHKANLGAESLRARYLTTGASLPGCDANSSTATLALDGVSYDAVPRVLAWDSIPSVALRGTIPGNRAILILNRVGGNLSTGGLMLDGIFGILYDDAERGYSFGIYGGCQIKQELSDYFPRTVPRISSVIPAGRTGWMKLWPTNDYGILGAGLYLNTLGGFSATSSNQGHNLHKLTLSTQSTYVMPVIPPNC